MNKVIYYDGLNDYKPFKFEDIKHDIDALTLALNDLYTASSLYTKYIVTGCALTQVGSNVELSTGSIFYNGEYYKVDPKTFNNTDISVIRLYSFDLIESWDTKGLFTFYDNSVKNTYKVRKAQLVSSSITFTDTVYSNMKNINSDLVSLLPDATASIKGVTLLTSNDDVIYGTDNTKAVTPLTLANKIPTFEKVFDLGAWDMDSNSTLNTYDFSVSGATIVDLTLIINDDDNLFRRNFLEGGTYYMVPASGIITFTRTASGIFDSTSYNDPTMNRGTLYIKYKLN